MRFWGSCRTRAHSHQSVDASQGANRRGGGDGHLPLEQARHIVEAVDGREVAVLGVPRCALTPHRPRDEETGMFVAIVLALAGVAVLGLRWLALQLG